MLKKIRSKIVHSKLFAHRAMSWLSVINAGMILFLVLSQLEKYGVDLDITIWFLPIFASTILLLVIFGYLEDKLGFYEQESFAAANRNPYFKQITQRLDDIENELKRIKK